MCQTVHSTYGPHPPLPTTEEVPFNPHFTEEDAEAQGVKMRSPGCSANQRQGQQGAPGGRTPESVHPTNTLCEGVRAGRFCESPGQGTSSIPEPCRPRGPRPTWPRTGAGCGLREKQNRVKGIRCSSKDGKEVWCPTPSRACRHLRANVPTPELGARCGPVRCPAPCPHTCRAAPRMGHSLETLRKASSEQAAP